VIDERWHAAENGRELVRHLEAGHDHREALAVNHVNDTIIENLT
jgi:hypothetical protein